jgi:hypothetical protein
MTVEIFLNNRQLLLKNEKPFLKLPMFRLKIFLEIFFEINFNFNFNFNDGFSFLAVSDNFFKKYLY